MHNVGLIAATLILFPLKVIYAAPLNVFVQLQEEKKLGFD